MRTITVKNIPEDVYKALKRRAKTHRRSINSEIIMCIEKSVTSTKIDKNEYLGKIRQLRNSLGFNADAETIDEFKRRGRA